MLTIYDAADGALIKRDGVGRHEADAVWIDLLNPTKDEDLLVEQDACRSRCRRARRCPRSRPRAASIRRAAPTT